MTLLPSAPSMKIICLDHMPSELLQIVHQESMYTFSPMLC